MAKKKSQLGKLLPRYRFFLNPYQDSRFTRCPQCDQPTKARKHPFFIHVDPQYPIILNMTGKYCPRCDLLILHQNKVEELLTAAMMQHNPTVIGNEYLIVGTMERKGWRESQKNPRDFKMVLEYLHDFKEMVTFEPQHYGWVPDDK